MQVENKNKERRWEQEDRKNEVSTEFISKQQQKTSNDKDFYEMFQIWSNVNLLLKNIYSQQYLIIDD